MKPFTLALSVVSLVVSTLGSSAQAQTVYRIVGPDGKVTFSDKAPVDDKSKVTTAAGASPAAGTTPNLPFELRQVVQRYPVVLYTGANCPPCDSGRSLLNSRGIPFSERTITTKEDHDQLRRVAGDTSLPYLQIGAQRMRGFSDVEWSQYLDAAGYPKSSVLPASYKNPEPAPLVAVQKAQPAPKPEPKPEPPPPPPPPAPAGSNPAGITF